MVTGVSVSGTGLVLISMFPSLSRYSRTDGGQQRQRARCEAPLGGSQRSAGATAADSHVIQSKAQKRKRSVL